MNTFLRDVKHSIRMFLKSPGFTVTAIAALALGVGATTAIFSIVNAVLLKPIPVPDPDRFVVLMNTFAGASGESNSNMWASPAKFAHWRAQSSVLEDVAAYSTGIMNYTGGEIAEQLRSGLMSLDAFKCWGLPILQGRTFTEEEDLPNGPRVALISQDLWTRRFANDPRMLGRTISLSGEAYTVIGIVADNPSMLEFGPQPEVFVPFQLDPNSADQGHYFNVVARLKPGVSLEQAKARLKFSATEFRNRFPTFDPKAAFTVLPYREAVAGDNRASLLVLLGAVGMVLLIACANVANLLLVRAAGRRREIAIRAALGAGRGRMIRQLLTESVILSLAGGFCGLLLGYSGMRALLEVNTAGLPRLGENGIAVGIDWRVVAFAIGVSLATGIVFGLFPALQGSRADLNSVLKDSGGRSGTGLKQNKARAALVVSEVGLAVILLIGSALMIRTFTALYAVDRGFDTNNVVTMHMSLTGPKYLETAGVADTVRDGLERLQAIPGVVVAGATCCIPLQGGFGLPFNVIGRPAPSTGPYDGQGGWWLVSPGFFEVYKIPVKRGRSFTSRDDASGPPVVLINEAMAKQYWKDSDPLKDRIVIGKDVMKEMKEEPARQIVGIVGDVRDSGLNNDPRPNMYVPQAQVTNGATTLTLKAAPMAWVVRTQGDPHALVPAIQEQIRQATNLPLSDIRSMDDIVAISTARQRFNMLLMTVFGSMALLLAAIGIYGLMAYTVEQRTQEIGIRLALGAETSQVRGMVVRQGMGLALAGVAAGLAAAWALARVLESFLFGVKARDPLVFLAVPFVLALVALFAVWLPANRASRVNPIDSLRYE